jgi:putative membrane protein
MVAWDLSMDPLRATVERRWIWRHGGPHFGVPLENYVGWALVTWTMFQSFALALPRIVGGSRVIEQAGSARYWLSVPLAYASFAAEYLLNPFAVVDDGTSVLVNGVELQVAQIFHEVALLTLSTMVPLALLAAILACRSHLAWGSFRPTGAGLPVSEEHS